MLWPINSMEHMEPWDTSAFSLMVNFVHLGLNKSKKNNLRTHPIQTGWWLGHPSQKYEFVNWDDDIPNINGKMPKMATSHHQPVLFMSEFDCPFWGSTTAVSWKTKSKGCRVCKFGLFPVTKDHELCDWTGTMDNYRITHDGSM